MRRFWIGTTTALGLWALLGCSGLSQGMRDAALEQLADAEESVRGLDKAKQKKAVGKLVTEVKELAEAEETSVILLTGFAVATNEACADGDINDEEMQTLETLVAELRKGE